MATPPNPMPIRKEFNCTLCDHFQLFNGAGPEGTCRAHPPRHCTLEFPENSPNYWPDLSIADHVWCDEWKRAQFATPQTDPRVGPHNPTNNVAAMDCRSCDHYQPAPVGGEFPHPKLGICMAHPPLGTCTEDPDDRETNAFPTVDNTSVPTWCSEWKRRATD